MPNRIKIILAEDQQLIRDSLQQLLISNPSYAIVTALSNGRHVVNFLDNSKELPDLCILDIQMPELDGIDCAKYIRKHYPAIKIVLLTSFNTESYMEEGLLSEVNGYILKDASIEAFDRALKSVLDGQFVAPWPLMNMMVKRLKHLSEIEQSRDFQYTNDLVSHYHSLEEQDIQIIRLIWLGWTNRMIADDLYLSEGTVKNYISRIYRKLRINTRAELMNLLGNLSK